MLFWYIISPDKELENPLDFVTVVLKPLVFFAGLPVFLISIASYIDSTWVIPGGKGLFQESFFVWPFIIGLGGVLLGFLVRNVRSFFKRFFSTTNIEQIDPRRRDEVTSKMESMYHAHGRYKKGVYFGVAVCTFGVLAQASRFFVHPEAWDAWSQPHHILGYIAYVSYYIWILFGIFLPAIHFVLATVTAIYSLPAMTNFRWRLEPFGGFTFPNLTEIVGILSLIGGSVVLIWLLDLFVFGTRASLVFVMYMYIPSFLLVFFFLPTYSLHQHNRREKDRLLRDVRELIRLCREGRPSTMADLEYYASEFRNIEGALQI